MGRDLACWAAGYGDWGSSMSVITAQPFPVHTADDRSPQARSGPLGSYRTASGVRREIVTLEAAQGSMLLIDRAAGTGGDVRLVAQFDRDEPAANAQLVATMYLADPTRGRCRRLAESDLHAPAIQAERDPAGGPAGELRDRDGAVFRIESVEDSSGGHLRWTRTEPDGQRTVVSLRHVIGRLEAYEPALTIARRAIDGEH